jgi:serine/threonine protein kinase
MSPPPNPDNAPIDATLAALEPGFLVGSGRFTLVRMIGRGGMGVVWLARDESLREDVALKFLPTEIRFDAVALDDLRRETARARKLTHPNIIRIHDLFKDDRDAFISMEYVDGPNLSDLRIEQPGRVFTWRFLEPLVKQLCEALDYAHSEKVIHRDLKPANMMLDSRGRLKLSDFGIAAQVSDSVTRVSMLRHGQSGTITHMSPQQMDGKLPQTTDDIYALGATLYELLTSQAPFFTGDIPYQVRNLLPQPIHERLVDLGIQNDVPKPVAAMIMACLGKAPEQRPQLARAVAEWIGLQPATTASVITSFPVSKEEASGDVITTDALAPPAPISKETRVAPAPELQPASEMVEEDATEVMVTYETSHARSRKFLIIGIVSVVVLAGVGVGVFAWWLIDRGALSRPNNSTAQRGIASSDFLKSEHVLTGHKATVSSVTFSPNQEFLISGSADGTVRVYETSRGELKWSANADVGPVWALSVSRENKLVAAAGENGLIRLFALESGNVLSTLRTHSSPIYAVVFSPAGTYLASADDSGTIALWDYQKGTASGRWNAHNTAVRALAFAPNGSQVASGSEDQSVRVWNVSDGALLKVLTGHRSVVRSVAFSANGLMLVSSSRDRSARIWNTRDFSNMRTIQWGSDANTMHGIAFSPDSRFIAAGSPRGVKVFKVETAARGADRMLKASGVMRPVTFSPDGSAIVAGGENGLVYVWPFRGEALFGGTTASLLASTKPGAMTNRRSAHPAWLRRE